ncbi:unnamed protein product, partial [Staurois parvus]
MQGPGRPDIVNAGSGETRYSECRVWGLVTLYCILCIKSGYSECRVQGEWIYSECRVQGE